MDPLIKQTPLQLAQAIVDPDADPEGQVLASVEAARLRRRVASLPQLDRYVVTWRYGINGGEKLSRRQIGQRLGMPVWRVRAIEERALELLRGSYVELAA